MIISASSKGIWISKAEGKPLPTINFYIAQTNKMPFFQLESHDLFLLMQFAQKFSYRSYLFDSYIFLVSPQYPSFIINFFFFSNLPFSPKLVPPSLSSVDTAKIWLLSVIREQRKAMRRRETKGKPLTHREAPMVAIELSLYLKVL